jgi:hypothetical protein
MIGSGVVSPRPVPASGRALHLDEVIIAGMFQMPRDVAKTYWNETIANPFA